MRRPECGSPTERGRRARRKTGRSPEPFAAECPIEVLYLHGHRSSPQTWVLSRSQYEDLPTTRPVLLTRVRQLLSQHPVLTVGYSLTDPDFHQVYRQLSLDMKTKCPPGLALLG